MEKVKIGRWIYCKYCYQNVKPLLGGVYQVICPKCGYGLTPDFFSAQGLEVYIKTKDYDAASKCKEELIAKKAFNRDLFDEVFIKNEKDINGDDEHTSQLYAREVSKLAIKKYKENDKQRILGNLEKTRE